MGLTANNYSYHFGNYVPVKLKERTELLVVALAMISMAVSIRGASSAETIAAENIDMINKHELSGVIVSGVTES